MRVRTAPTTSREVSERRKRSATAAPPTMAAVNLLSPAALDRIAARRLRGRFAAAGAVLVVVVAAAWGAQHLRVAEAEQLLAVEQAETARLTQETQELLPVRAFVAGVQQQLATVSETMSREIYVSLVLDGLQDAAPSGVQVDSVAVTIAPEPTPAATDPATTEGAAGEGAPAPTEAPQTSPCPGPDPFNTRTVVGCVTLSGTADSRAEVGELVIRLGEDQIFVEPFISTTTTADASRVSFSGSVGLGKRVFSTRYDDLEALIAEGGDR
jgi:hypothetical protein